MKNPVICLLLLPLAAFARQDAKTDSISATLEEIVVEAVNQRLGPEVSTYIPTSKQKNAAQTAADLLNRIAIPQLQISPDGNIAGTGGKSVDVFVDFLPASKDDLAGMRLQDVKRVEYYDFPADPRFQGKAHVVNFVMQKYEYGGYVKASGWENTGNAGQLSLYGKLQYKRLTVDMAAGAFYLNQSHSGADICETFRLPRADGTVNTFTRSSFQSSGAMYSRRTYWPTVKALYASDKITLQNVIGASFDHIPTDSRSGFIEYYTDVFANAGYSERSSARVNALSYSGYWNFIINDRNTVTFSPKYSYSHTNKSSLYAEESSGEYYNAARDNTHQLRGDLTFAHSFGKPGNLNLVVRTLVSVNNTDYFGTAGVSDYVRTCRLGPGAQYSLSTEKVYGLFGLGYDWDERKYLGQKENSAAPWIDFSLQYAPDGRHSVSGEFHYAKSIPPSSCRSSAVIQSNPLMSYTGNPDVVPYDGYDAGVNYTFIPGNRFRFSAFASEWVAKNRYVYDYQATESGILRTVRQPGGTYSHLTCGVYGTVYLLDHNLQLTAQVIANTVSNGAPYNLNKTHVNYAFQASYYTGNFTLSGIYYASQRIPEGMLTATWTTTKPYYMLQAGWANSSWNIQLQVVNFARWNWQSDKSVMHSRYYDRAEQSYSINDHAFARLSLTYTFGFGKKVQHGDEASQQSSAPSGILQ